MALVPTRQFYLDSFQSSFSKFHDSTLLFFRYTSSIRPKPQTFCYNLPNEKNPPRNPQADHKNVTLSTSNWLYQWNKPNKESRPKPPQAVLNYRGRGNSNSGSGSTMDRIVEKLKKHGYIEGAVQGKTQERVIEKGSVEDIFYVEEGMLPNARGGFSKESPLGVEDVFKVDGEVRFPWEKPKRVENQDDEEGKWTARSKSRTSLAELTLPESELKRLRYLTYQMKSRVRVKGAGVTEEVVNTIHERWKTSEIVRVKVEGAPALNMRRTHDILERKTGGLVVWRSGASISLYRGVSYEVPSVQQNKRIFRRNELSGNSLPITTGKPISCHPTIVSYNEAESSQLNLGSNAEAKKKDTEGFAEVEYEDEVDKLLDGLGPRYTDWPGCNPLPVDADLLPGTVPGYQPPFRILPYGVRSSLGRKEATSLQRLARVLPPHFALGRSRQLQGLAVAMIKLWEKSSIAKVALKRGVQLTASERMAEDIKKLTGGMLLSRNKDFLVFYRGKDFLSPDVTEALLEREALATTLQDEEEQARLRASALIIPTPGETEQLGTAGTLEETWDAKARWGKRLDDSHKENMMRQAEMGRHASLVRKLERKLAFAERRIVKAERALSKVEEFLKPADRQADPGSITDEERFMFRKLGLRMKAFLLLGRRGVFDGTVENMHLHWKYRELVKIILKAQNFEQVKKIALALEAESGGVLVSVDKISKGYAIIVYRGKDYERPSTLRPRNLLTKRKALARSIEIQRREALLKHISALEAKVAKITSEIGEMNIVKDQGDDELYDRLESAYPTDDDDNGTKEEGDDAYLETYNSEDDAENHDDNDDDETCNEIQRAHPDRTFLYNAQNQAAERDSEDGEDEEFLETDGSENEDEDLGRDTLHENHPANFPYNVENQVAIREPEVGMGKHIHE